VCVCVCVCVCVVKEALDIVIWTVWAQGPLTYLVASTSSQVEGPGSQGMCPAQAWFSYFSYDPHAMGSALCKVR
jgi:hypothetical protein